MQLSSPSLFSAETFEESARAVARAWEEEAGGEEEGTGARPSSVAWRWAAASSRFAAALGGGYLEAHSSSASSSSSCSSSSNLLPGVSIPLRGAEAEGEPPGEGEEDGGDELDAATLPRAKKEGPVAPQVLRVELHVCFGASYRSPLMLVRGSTTAAATAAAGPSSSSFCSLEALERSLAAAAASSAATATGAGAPCASGPLAPCEHPLLPQSGGWAALHACASAGAVAEMMIPTATEEGEEEQEGRGSGTQPPSSLSDPKSSSRSAASSALAAWMSLACPAVGVRPPLGMWRRVKERENV